MDDVSFTLSYCFVGRLNLQMAKFVPVLLAFTTTDDARQKTADISLSVMLKSYPFNVNGAIIAV